MVEPTSHLKSLTATVGDDDPAGRLDKFLANAVAELSRTRLKSLIIEGLVSVGGAKITDPAYRVKPGETYYISIPVVKPAKPRAQAIDLTVVYEDDDLIVIDKPAGLVVHPAAGNPDNTLVNALIHHCGDSLSGIGGDARPGIVHRLDKDTSGLMLAAKNDLSHHHLARQFSDHSLERAYKAVVWGVLRPRAGIITGNVGRSSRNRKKMAVVKRGGKEATTHYKVLSRLGEWATLVECRLETGRTHQIRVHLSSIGHSVIGDALYGGGGKKIVKMADTNFSNAVTKLSRQALHAYLIGFIHPKSGESLRFESLLPKDIENLL